VTAGALRPLPRSFLARPAPVVARELLGRLLVSRTDGRPLVARIVECEAYQEDDPASHSFRERTPRTEVMFGPPGHLYVYFTYGMHFCMNVVTGRAGEGSAVLLRAAEPLDGQDPMAQARGLSRPYDPRLLCSGPARLTQAFGVTREANGIDLLGQTWLALAAGAPVPDDEVGVSARVGIRVGRERPWRFFVAGSPFVSRGPRELTPKGSPR
jgi:DNA-3-methyladenine glycosylase